MLTVYTNNPDPNNLLGDYSFNLLKKNNMSYSQFLSTLVNEQTLGSVVLKEGNTQTGIVGKLIGDIIMPEFYTDIAELEGFELIQGSHFVDKPHYEKKEQLICVIDGQVDVITVPYIYRQEVYAGKEMSGSQYDQVSLNLLSKE